MSSRTQGGIKLWQSEPPRGAKDLGTMKLEIGLPWFLRWVQASWDLCKGLVGMSASEATCGGKQSDWETGLMTEEGATHQQMQAASGSQESRGESRYWSPWERHHSADSVAVGPPQPEGDTRM